MDRIEQNNNIIQTKKTIEWLVENTTVSVFNPIDFTGYQRQIEDNDCQGVVNYLKQSCLLPVSIVCACDGEFSDNKKLRVIDGQYIVNSFKILKKNYNKRYNEIMRNEIPVIVIEFKNILNKEKQEAETFIAINKISKKIDVSLAYVLKNKLTNGNSSELTIPRAEYVAVEVARKINNDERNTIWYDRILFDINQNKTYQYINLNDFVKATRPLIKEFSDQGIISLNWKNKDDADYCIKKVVQIIMSIWINLYKIYPNLKEHNSGKIIQSSIGYIAINKFVFNLIRCFKFIPQKESIEDYIERWFLKISVPFDKWKQNGEYSKYTSVSGYKFIANELLRDIGYNS